MGGEPIEILRYSTADLPPDERYRAWLARDWPRTDAIFRTEPSEPFDTTFESAVLGEIMVVRTTITAMRWERRQQDIRTSDFDPIVVNMMVDGLAQGDMDGRAFREPSGTFHFHDLARPSLHVSSASFTYSIIAPRPVAVRWFGTLDDLHGLVVGGPGAAMLSGQAEQLWRMLPELDVAMAPALGRAAMETLVAASAGSRAAPVPGDAAKSGLRRRAEDEIERVVGAGVDVAALCERLGVSRARLYAAFQDDGGVQAYAATVRLDRARAALADLGRSEPIGTIAHRLGFSDAPQLSRAFRQRYGMTPRDYRALIRSDTARMAQDAAA